jgi:uncharacterized membrane protein YhaH (DUF805 family)
LSKIYAAPNADLTDEASSSETVFFAVNGRIGRVRWIGYMSAMYLLVSLAIGVLAALASLGGMQDLKFVPLFSMLAMFAAFMLVCRRRLQDLGMGNLALVLGVIPFINLYFYFMMIFNRGDDFANEYGPTPAPNNRSAILLAWILPGIMIIGIVAAIALPAYSKYMDKARAEAPTQQR